jgi:chromate transporter
MSTSAAHQGSANAVAIPHESLANLFLRFLRFGLLAWGGPMAQIAMLRQSFVDEERWITGEHFNRALALYQVLPGPEAHELCVYFGMLARGRIGGVLAGLGFMLPGFALMLVLSWAYVSLGLDVRGELALLFAAIQAAVVALIVRAVHRIGSHVLVNRWLWGIAIVCAAGQLIGVHFGVLLLAGGLAYVLAQRWPLIAFACLFTASIGTMVWLSPQPGGRFAEADGFRELAAGSASLGALFWSGLKAGSLTFGGAYTAIPFLQRDAVGAHTWMSNAQFMDGIALAGLLPAPLIIFATFVGYVAGGPLGSLVITLGIFLPAFVLTLVAHEPMERLVHHPSIRPLLDGVTAAVVGLIAGTALALLATSIRSVMTALVFAAALAALFYWNARLTIPVVVAGAALVGLAATVL